MDKMQKTLSFRDIKNTHTIGLSSIPKKQRSSYLELYMLKKENDRLEKEIFALEKRRKTACRQLDSVKEQIEKLREEISNEEGKLTRKSENGKEGKKVFRTMPIKY